MINSRKFHRYGMSVVSIISVVLLMSCSNRTDLQNRGLNGKVRSCTERVHHPEKKGEKFDAGEIEDFGNHNCVKFNEKGEYTGIEYLDPEGNLFARLTPKRENGKIIEEGFFDEDGKLMNNTKITYISDDETEFESFDDTGERTAKGKTFSKNGRITKQTYTLYVGADADKEFTITFEYDTNGNKIEQKQVDNNGNAVFSAKYEYLEFDKQNNWIKMLAYRDGEPESVLVREIEYY